MSWLTVLLLACRGSGFAALLLNASVDARPPLSQDSKPAAELPPFLTLFLHRDELRVVGEEVQWPTAWGRRSGTWVHRALGADERLPALLLLPGEPDHAERAQRAAREFAEIGYGVLIAAVAKDAQLEDRESAGQRVLAELGAAVHWLRRRDDVFPDRIGAVGWSKGADWALRLAAATGLQACVACDAAELDRATAGALRRTPIFLVQSGELAAGADGTRWLLTREGPAQKVMHFPDAKPGFLFPDDPAYRFLDSEQAWFEIYEFVDEYLEDAHAAHGSPHRSTHAATPPAATLAEFMRSLNGPFGVRGRIAETLNGEPDDGQWKLVRANGALLVEGSQLWGQRRAPRGDAGDWRQQVERYRESAQALAESAGTQKLAEARQALTNLNNTCAACHLKHR